MRIEEAEDALGFPEDTVTIDMSVVEDFDDFLDKYGLHLILLGAAVVLLLLMCFFAYDWHHRCQKARVAPTGITNIEQGISRGSPKDGSPTESLDEIK